MEEDKQVQTQTVEIKKSPLIRTKLANLIDVKTLLTLSIIWAIIGLAYRGELSPESIKDMGLMIIGYFFGSKKLNEDKKG